MAATALCEKDCTLAKMIDHTLLRPDASKEELARLCDEAKQFGFATVCVNSSNIPFVSKLLRGSRGQAHRCGGISIGGGKF